jgi:type VI secretion system secreted protein Hcp
MYDAFLQIAGLKGESTRAGFEGQTELKTFSWGASNSSSMGSSGPGGGVGKAKLDSFKCTKATDLTSPPLFQACCSGKHFPRAKVTLIKSGGDSTVPYLVYEFEKVFVSDIQWEGEDGKVKLPTETVELSFGKVTITYTSQTDTGGVGTPVVASWNVQTVTP